MGLIAGVMLEKTAGTKETPLSVCKKAEKYVVKVPLLMQKTGDYAKVDQLLSEMQI